MSIKGYPTSKKSLGSIQGYSSEQTTSQSQFITAQEAGSDHVALDMSQRALYQVSNGNIVASAFKRFLTCVGINALKGDVIRFTSGVLDNQDFPILSAPNGDTMILATEFDTVPSIGDTFELYRFTFVQVDRDGSQLVTVQPAPISIMKDGVVTDIVLDTIAPHNHVPIPVCITDVSGGANVSITAGDINVSIKHTGVDPSSVRLGDGTTEVGVTLSEELQVYDENSLIELTALNTAIGILTAEVETSNANLINGDIYINAALDNIVGAVLVTPTLGKKKIRLVQNAGAELYIFKGASKIGALEKGGKLEFFSVFDGVDSLIIKAIAGTVSTNICWNISE